MISNADCQVRVQFDSASALEELQLHELRRQIHS
jgi:hypothetical protein